MKTLNFLLLLLLVSCVSGESALEPIRGGNSVQNNPPALLFITPPANGNYFSGLTLTFTAVFSSNVCVSGTPRISLNLDGVTKYAERIPEACGTNVRFMYTAQAGDLDANGITLGALSLNGGRIFDNASNLNASLGYTPPNTSGILVNVAVPAGAYVTGFNAPIGSPQASGHYERGMPLYIEINFNQIVNVTGTPGMTLRLGTNGSGAVRNANYFSGSGTSTLRFRYIVSSGDLDTDGLELDTAPPSLVVNTTNSIKAADNSDADVLFTSPGPFINLTINGSLGPELDTLAPLTNPITAIYRDGSTLDFIVNFNRPVRVQGGTPHMDIKIGSLTRTADWISDGGTHTSTQTFRYQVGRIEGGKPRFDMDLVGVQVLGLSYNGSGFYDQYGSVASAINNSDIQDSTGAVVLTSQALHWYDLARVGTVTAGSGSTLVGFNDILGSGRNGNLFGSIPYDGNSMTFTASSQYITLNSSIPTLNYFLMVIDTQDENPGTILFDNTAPNSLFNYYSGTFDSNSCSGQSCSYLDSSGVWQTVADGNFSGITSTPASKKVIALNFQGLTNVLMRFSNSSTAKIHEVIMVSSVATNIEVLTLANHLRNKHSASF